MIMPQANTISGRPQGECMPAGRVLTTTTQLISVRICLEVRGDELRLVDPLAKRLELGEVVHVAWRHVRKVVRHYHVDESRDGEIGDRHAARQEPLVADLALQHG